MWQKSIGLCFSLGIEICLSRNVHKLSRPAVGFLRAGQLSFTRKTQTWKLELFNANAPSGPSRVLILSISSLLNRNVHSFHCASALVSSIRSRSSLIESMSGPPREKSVNHAESGVRPVLGPAGNKARSLELRKPAEKLKSNKVEKSPESDGGKKSSVIPPAAAAEGADQLSKPRFQVATSKKCGSVGSVLRRQQEQRSFLMRSNLSMNASCSSDASSESSQSQASTGNISLDSLTPRSSRRRQCGPKTAEKAGSEVESLSMSSDDFPLVKKRCAWVTTNTDPLYAAFHDDEWGVPVHDDRNLFELLSLCTALAELSWPTILSKRQAFREVFQNFDPVAVSKLNEKKITVPGNPASSLLSELKLRAIIENARHVCKIIDEIGSFDKYIWGFVNHRPIVGQFRYPRQVPIKTSKAEAISKDLVRRGFRGVGPTVIYSFMQVSGITNDHLISCFRFQECMACGNARNKGDSLSAAKLKVKQPEDDNAELGPSKSY